MLRLLATAALLAAVGACDINKYRLGGDADAATDGGVARDGDPGDGRVDGDGGPGDGGGGPDACAAVVETCNQRDDDCDLQVDEDFDLTANPAHCGACGRRCAQPNTAGTCVASQCQYQCLPGWVDRDNDPTNGCDYFCTPTNGGVEACDLVDNDCNGQIDDGLALDTDVDNCGACGNVCRALHASPTCVGGVCGSGPCEIGRAHV